MLTYIISLAESQDRRNYIIEQASSKKLAFEIIDAVNGKNIANNLLSILKKEHSYAVTPGEIGCSLSHLVAYKKLLDSNHEAALILEDDVIIPDGINNLLLSISKKVDKKNPNVYLLSKVNHFNKKKEITISDKIAIHEAYNACFTHAYIINRKAAKNLLDKLLPIWCVADQWSTFKDFGYVNIFCLIPECINTNPELDQNTTIINRDDTEIRKMKEQAWHEINKKRTLRIRVKKMLFLIFKRPFIKIVKH
ncbi:MAG: glycosyltransferase family 25 protein [Plesiomonas shigelloides]